MSRKSMNQRREFYASLLADLRKPFLSPSRNFPIRKAASKMYLLKSKLPVLTDEDQRPYDRLLRQLEATIAVLGDQNASDRDKLHAIQRLLASVEMVRPDIQGMWRVQFVDYLGVLREMAWRFWQRIAEAESK